MLRSSLVQPLPRGLPTGLPATTPRIGAAFNLLILLASAGLGACDIPTDAPEWEQRWILPADETTVDVEEILPTGMEVTPDNTAFTVQVEPVSFQESLGGLCQACQVLNGLTVPKPPFQGSFQERALFPSEVVGVEVRDAQVRVEAWNGLGFDPIRPAAGSTGTLTLSLRDGGPGGRLLDRIVVDGATRSFPSGTTLTETLQFSGPVEEAILVVLEVSSPLGDPVTINVNQSVAVDATVQTLEVTSAVADLSGETFEMDETDMDTEDVDESIVDRIQSGALEFRAQNPWAVGASVNVIISGPFTPITKSFVIPEGLTSEGRIEFTRQELQTFLGQSNVTLTGFGTVNPGAGEATLTPGQTLILETILDLTIRIGGEGS